MDVFDLAQIVGGHSENGELYHEFFKAKRLSVGLYVLKAGEIDLQSPHTEDEIYYIVSGAGTIEIDGEHREVSAGSVICGRARDPPFSYDYGRPQHHCRFCAAAPFPADLDLRT